MANTIPPMGNNNDPFQDLYKQLARMSLTSTGAMNNFRGGQIYAVPMSAPSNPFHDGQRVALISGGGARQDPEYNPIWGKDGNYIAGTVRVARRNNEVVIHFDDGRENMFHLEHCQIVLLEDAPAPKMFKVLKLNTTPLEALVIAEKTRDEIIAVLKQHQNADKIFKEWGLGEVLEYGKGMTFMFYGPPGTGKTWGATCIAKALGTTLLTISAAEIQSSEPGGANRSIQNAFSTAREKGQVLFIDECDSLIANRAHLGMILSSEVNTLLTEIEKCEGVVILATNMIGNMDRALERRISMIVEFPMPDFENRIKIWKKLIPQKFPMGEDVKIEDLAKEEFSGGQIKNVILQAARLAVSGDSKVVALIHFKTAIDRLLSSRGVMGTDSRYDQRRHGVDVGVSSGTVSKFLERGLEEGTEKGV